jgi:hypothetical protein
MLDFLLYLAVAFIFDLQVLQSIFVLVDEIQ